MRGIVLIVIDCLRADHVTSYGYERATTPTIDALAERGILWERAYSLSSWTKPSVTSLLTGLYPSEHGAFLGVKRSKGRTGATTDVLRSTRPTLAESFTHAGWRCGAFINNAQLSAFTRLDRGFETYEPTAGKADRLIGMFEAWMRQDAQTPSFAYLHFLEAHWPYKPRRRHVAMFGGNRDTNGFGQFSARDYGKLRRAISRGQRTLSENELEQMIQMYDGSVRRLDGKVKIVLGVLDSLGIRDETAVIVTADHGDEFLDHGSIGHGHTLFDELTHVPMVAVLPGIPRAERRSEPVSQIDLPCTLLNAAGIDHELSGHDLLSTGGVASPVCSELSIRNRYTQTLHDGAWKLHRRFRFEPDGRVLDTNRSRRDWTTTYPYSVTDALYDLRTDPTEQNDLAELDDHAQPRAELLAKLDAWWASHGQPAADTESGEVEIDDRVVARLRDLGYLD